MGAVAQATGGAAPTEAKPPTRPTPAAKLAPERPPRGRSGGGTTRALSKPPQGHSGYNRKVSRKPPRSSGAPRYETTNARERMLVSARQLAEQRGYESLRIADITDPVGVRRQAFYAHFKDKRDCLCEVIDPKLCAVLELATAEEEDAPRWAEHVISAIDETLQERFHSPDGTRARIVTAMIEMLRETESFDAIRIGKLVKRAHVLNGDFYRQFSGKRECFAVAYEQMLDGLTAEVPAECPAEHTRQDLPALLGCLGSALSSDPVRLRLLVTQASYLLGDPNHDEAGAWRGSLGEGIAELLAASQGAYGVSPTLRVVASSLVEVTRASIIEGEIDALPDRLQQVGEGLGIAGSGVRSRAALVAA